ncbi:MAG: Unknown protein [uncultured Sulfurovum sp.]|uniref:Uncharacterized protein n=1 Tax=uncultured Sulfurovum sp. TaxID=269237 RepID=A0A6S6T834_9BACT|nr:MAG: Unknown protein [uncultured Sulfurovum sp.]
MKIDDEPTLDTIDDYNNNESPEKRKTIYLIIAGLVIFMIGLSIIKVTNDTVSDYIGTSSSLGIDVSKH